MKKQLELAQNFTLIIGSLLLMFAFVMGANAENQDIKSNWIIVMFFSEMLVLYSCISMYVNKNNDKK